MDREKVIERLEYCAETRDGYVRDCINDALALLKEQEAVKPKVDAFGHPYCPKCKILVYETWEFCPHCGQAVKWE